MSSKTPLKTIYFLVKDHQISFCSTNFKAVYETLKEHNKLIGLKDLKSYSTCVNVVKSGKSLVMPSINKSTYKVHSMPIHTKVIEAWELLKIL